MANPPSDNKTENGRAKGSCVTLRREFVELYPDLSRSNLEKATEGIPGFELVAKVTLAKLWSGNLVTLASLRKAGDAIAIYLARQYRVAVTYGMLADPKDVVPQGWRDRRAGLQQNDELKINQLPLMDAPWYFAEAIRETTDGEKSAERSDRRKSRQKQTGYGIYDDSAPVAANALHSAGEVSGPAFDDANGPTLPVERPTASESRVTEDYLTALISATERLPLPLPEPVAPNMSELSIDIPLVPAPLVSAEQRNTVDRLRHTSAFASGEPEGKDVPIDLDLAITDRKRILIHGDPGSGKSTRLRLAACSYARKALDGKRGHIPILLKCRRFAVDRLPEDLSDAIIMALEDYVPRKRLNPLADHLEQRLQTEGGLLLVDAIDEIPPEVRAKFCEALMRWVRYSDGVAIVVTSRAVGVLGFQNTLSEQFETCRVDRLPRESKSEFLNKLQQWKGLEISSNSIDAITDSETGVGRLTDTALMLALAAQVVLVGQQDIGRNRIALLDQAIEELIARKAHLQEQPVRFEELVPFLEWLALSMKRQSKIRFFEADAVQAFAELRELETGVPDRRTDEELLRLAIHPIGLLAVAGKSYDERGTPREELQFIHQIYQEHFAARACCYRRGDANPVELIADQLGQISVINRTIKILRLMPDPVIATDWHETIRMMIGRLPEKTTADVFQAILPGPADDADTRRARAVFAVSCLADGPEVSPELLQRIIQEFCNVLQPEDDFPSGNERSPMRAIQAAISSELRERIIDELLSQIQQECSVRAIRIGKILCGSLPKDPMTIKNVDSKIAVLEESIGCPSINTRLLTLLSFVKSSHDGLGNSCSSLSRRELMISILLKECHLPGTERLAALWGLRRLKADSFFDIFSSVPPLKFSVDQLDQIESIAIDELTSDVEAIYAAWLISENHTPVPEYYMTEYFNIIYGSSPRWLLPSFIAANMPRLSDSIVRRLEQNSMVSELAFENVLVLRRLGVHSPLAIKVVRIFLKDNWNGNSNDLFEAAIALGSLGSADSVFTLLQLREWKPDEFKEYGEYVLHGILLADNVDATVRILADGDFYPNELALCLAGSREKVRGLELLTQLAEHPDEQVRSAVAAAIKKREEWDQIYD